MHRPALATAVLAAVFAVAAPAPARADVAGDAALTAVDLALNRGPAHEVELDVTTTAPGKPAVKARVRAWIKGERRLVAFVAPSDLAGTRLLILSPTQAYVYLPSFGKTRRIALTTSDGGLFGSAVQPADLDAAPYASRHSATIVGGTLVLTPTSADAPYGRLEMTIAKATQLPTEIKTFDRQGQLVRTETRGDYTCGQGSQKGVCVPGTVRVDDTRRRITTTLVRTSWSTADIPDDVFAKRRLQP